MQGRPVDFDLHARVGAALIDSFLIAFGPLSVALVLSTVSAGALTFYSCGFGLLYYVFCEAKYGQTPGKRVFGIRVYALSGELTVGKVLVRTAFRLLDVLPFGYVIGFMFVSFSRRRQRIGDMIAGTIVIADHGPYIGELNALMDLVEAPAYSAISGR